MQWDGEEKRVPLAFYIFIFLFACSAIANLVLGNVLGFIIALVVAALLFSMNRVAIVICAVIAVINMIGTFPWSSSQDPLLFLFQGIFLVSVLYYMPRDGV